MNQLNFIIVPSKISHDHQVRIEIDGKDWLGEFIGVDPPEFFSQKNLFQNGKLLIGRCDCGCVGCCDTFVDVGILEWQVHWIVNEKLKFELVKSEYERHISLAQNDKFWENINRRVERLVQNVFANIVTNEGLIFEWASCRIHKNKINLSYSNNKKSKDYLQELFSFYWNGKDEQDALRNGKLFLERSYKINKKL